MSEFYGTSDEAESIATIHRALELGVTLLDTADMYRCGANELTCTTSTELTQRCQLRRL